MYRSKGTLTAIDLSEKQLETIKAIILDSKIIDIELDVNDDGRGDMRQVLVFSEPLSNIINKKLTCFYCEYSMTLYDVVGGTLVSEEIDFNEFMK